MKKRKYLAARRLLALTLCFCLLAGCAPVTPMKPGGEGLPESEKIPQPGENPGKKPGGPAGETDQGNSGTGEGEPAPNPGEKTDGGEGTHKPEPQPGTDPKPKDPAGESDKGTEGTGDGEPQPNPEPQPEPEPNPDPQPNPQPDPQPTPEPQPQPRPGPEELERMVERMTLEELAGQVFFLRPEDLIPAEDPGAPEWAKPAVTAVTRPVREGLAAFRPGGIALFGRNIEDPAQLKALTAGLQENSEIPLLIGMDEEGGRIVRIGKKDSFDVPHWESAQAVGNSGDPEQARQMGEKIGAYLKEYGVNTDFAPVADVNSNPDNPVINDRSFSGDPETAAAMAAAMARGLRNQGVLPVFKHFPGHGDTREDSHRDLAVLNKTRRQLEQCELIPFRQAGPEDAVMVGHIALPEITGDRVPASLSPGLVQGLLKTDLGFSGLVITDSLAMAAVTDLYGAGEAAVLALEAGCHMLLMPADAGAAFDAVVEAVEGGRLPRKTLETAVLNILQAKSRLNLFK